MSKDARPAYVCPYHRDHPALPHETCTCGFVIGPTTDPVNAEDDLVDRVADMLWARLDLNGHTADGVRRAASRIVEAVRSTRDGEIAELRSALLALYEAEKHHDPDDWRGEPAMIQAWEALGRPG